MLGFYPNRQSWESLLSFICREKTAPKSHTTAALGQAGRSFLVHGRAQEHTAALLATEPGGGRRARG